MSGWGWFLLILFILIIIYVVWLSWRIYTTNSAGEKLRGWKPFIPFTTPSSSTNYPTPRIGGFLETLKDKFARLRNPRSRTSGGGFEDSRVDGQYTGLGRRNREDDPWDTRVEHDPYSSYVEEGELGITPTPGVTHGSDYLDTRSTSYHGASLSTNQYANSSDGRGRSQNRDLDVNPFGDDNAAPSLRSVSPRPQPREIDTSFGHVRTGSAMTDGETSPISTKSIRSTRFREQI